MSNVTALSAILEVENVPLVILLVAMLGILATANVPLVTLEAERLGRFDSPILEKMLVKVVFFRVPLSLNIRWSLSLSIPFSTFNSLMSTFIVAPEFDRPAPNVNVACFPARSEVRFVILD